MAMAKIDVILYQCSPRIMSALYFSTEKEDAVSSSAHERRLGMNEYSPLKSCLYKHGGYIYRTGNNSNHHMAIGIPLQTLAICIAFSIDESRAFMEAEVDG